MTNEQYQDVPNGYVYLYQQNGWMIVGRGDFTTRMKRVTAPPEAAAALAPGTGREPPSRAAGR